MQRTPGAKHLGRTANVLRAAAYTLLGGQVKGKPCAAISLAGCVPMSFARETKGEMLPAQWTGGRQGHPDERQRASLARQ